MKNNQESKRQHGGYRPGSGRKKGVGEKIRASTILNEIYKTNKQSYAQLLVEELNKARMANDSKLVAQYLQWIGNKVVADKIDVDHTTMGESLHATFNFPQKELTDWTTIDKTIKLESK